MKLRGISRWTPVLLLVLGAVLIAVGVLVRQEHVIVFQKAVRICMECIGIG